MHHDRVSFALVDGGNQRLRHAGRIFAMSRCVARSATLGLLIVIDERRYRCKLIPSGVDLAEESEILEGQLPIRIKKTCNI